MADDAIPRRDFLKRAGVAGAAAATALSGRSETAQAQVPVAGAATDAAGVDAYLTLTAVEAAFLSAAYDTFIPADALSPSGTDCGLVVYMDRQLAGAWGGGARLYRSGPFLAGKPEHGYQLSLTPREYFAAGIKAANEWSRKTFGKEFDRLSAADRDAALKAMESGTAVFTDFEAKPFFAALYQSAMEGFFADPVYGGNRNKVSWRMVGYPGLPASYANKALQYRGKKVTIAAAIHRRLFVKREAIMAKVMKAVDAVMVGMGWSGSIMARELTKAGLSVVGLERGAPKVPAEDFALPRIRDELKYRVRQELMQDTGMETHTLRNAPDEVALPMRQVGYPPGRRRPRRCRRPLERRHLALPAERIRAAFAFDGAVRPQRHSGRHDDPGLGHHL